MKNYLSCLLFIGVVMLTPKLHAQPNYLNFVTDDFAAGVVFKDNFVWYASRGGLNRINRETDETVLFTSANSVLPTNYIQEIATYDGNQIWLQGRGKLVLLSEGELHLIDDFVIGDHPIRYQKKMEIDDEGNCFTSARVYIDNGQYFNFVKIAPNGEVTEIMNHTEWSDLSPTDYAVDNQGRIWVASTEKVYRIDGDEIIIFDENNSPLQSESSFTLHRMPDGRMMILERTSGVAFQYFPHLVSDSNWETIDLTMYSGFETHPIRNVLFNEDAIYFSATDGRVFKYFAEETLLLDFPNIGPVPFDYDKVILNISDDGNWWFHQYDFNNKRLYEYDGNTTKQHTVCNADLSSNLIQDIEVDNDGTVWVLSLNGVSSFEGTNWLNHTPAIYRSRFYLQNILIKSNNEIILVGNQDDSPGYSFATLIDGFWQHSSFPFSENQIYDAAIDSQDNIWLVNGESLWKFDGENWTEFGQNNTSLEEYIYEIYITPFDEIYVFRQNKIFNFDGADFEEIFTNANTGNIHSIFEDTAGNLWIKSSGHMQLLTNGTFLDITSELPIVPGNILDMQQDKNGVFWFATLEGFWKYDEVTWELFNEGVPEGSPNHIAIDSFNNVWAAASSAGAVVFNENGINGIQTSTKNIIEKNTSTCDLAWFPNPFEESINLDLPEYLQDGRLLLFDAQGQQVFQQSIQQTSVQLSLPNLESGIYFYQFLSQNQTCGGKLVKLRGSN